MGQCRIRGPFVCSGCKKEYFTRRPAAEANRFCSLPCYRENKKGNGRENQETKARCEKLSTHVCRRCKAPIERLRRMVCKSCTPEYNREFARARFAQQTGTTRSCRKCGKSYERSYTGGRALAYCSVGCKQAAASSIERGHRALRKAKIRALLRLDASDIIDPLNIFKRDRWICQLCKKPTPKGKRGSWDHDAPELDHIIPIAAGGSHTIENVQCSCRKCNNMKSAKPLGQMLLRIA